MSKRGSTDNGFLEMALGILAILAIGSLFKSDSAKVVSNKGEELLNDEEGMKRVDEELRALQKNQRSQHASIEVEI